MDFAGHDNLERRWPDYRTTVERWGLRHFAPKEFIGPLRWPDDWPDAMPTHIPPYPELVGNLQATAALADEIRHQWGGPVRVVSGWRPPVYNDLVADGAEDSMHLGFRALDLEPVDDYDVHAWIEHVERIVHAHRQRQNVAIGLGRYWSTRGDFVHIDTGWYDYHRDWHFSRHGDVDPRTQ